MEAVEAPGGGERQRWAGLNSHAWKSRRSSNAHANHFRLIWGLLKKIKQNMLAVSGDARCCVTQEVRGSRETLVRMRGGTASSQTEQPWTDRAVPGKTSKDKGQASLQDSSRAPAQFSARDFTAGCGETRG